MRLNDRKAVTLMEIMVTTVLFFFVISGVYTTFLIGTRSWTYYNESVVLKQEARRAIFTMCQELREGRNVFISKEPLGVTLNFYRPSVGNISYSWVTRGENAYQVIRTTKNQTRVLARYVSELSISQETVNDVTVQIRVVKLQKSGEQMDFSLKEKVALRATTGILKNSEEI